MDNIEPVFQIPVGLRSLERGRRVKKDGPSRYGIVAGLGTFNLALLNSNERSQCSASNVGQLILQVS